MSGFKTRFNILTKLFSFEELWSINRKKPFSSVKMISFGFERVLKINIYLYLQISSCFVFFWTGSNFWTYHLSDQNIDTQRFNEIVNEAETMIIFSFIDTMVTLFDKLQRLISLTIFQLNPFEANLNKLDSWWRYVPSEFSIVTSSFESSLIYISRFGFYLLC